MKRIIAIALCFLLAFPMMAFCASAAGAYVFEYAYSDTFETYMMCYPGLLPEGTYNVCIAEGGVEYVTKEPVLIEFQESEVAPGVFASLYGGRETFVSFPMQAELDIIICRIDGMTYFTAGDVRETMSVSITPVSGESTAIPTVSDALTTAISWVGTVTTSLLSGDLNPLLLIAAIPIAISAVFFSVKLIRKNSWGV